MVDLIRMAYGFDADKIPGGPNWLEMDRFDVIAKLPRSRAGNPEADAAILLADRFKLVVHKRTGRCPPMLRRGKKPQLKEANGRVSGTDASPRAVRPAKEASG